MDYLLTNLLYAQKRVGVYRSHLSLPRARMRSKGLSNRVVRLSVILSFCPPKFGLNWRLTPPPAISVELMDVSCLKTTAKGF